MKVSVALCTFNGARYLSAQLASIEGQTRPPDEVVVRDDGSHDATPELLEAFRRRAPFPVRIETGPRLGSTANFEQAIARCTGDIIALADQDDVWRPHKLATLEQAFAADPAVGLAFSDARLLTGDGRLMSGSVWQTLGFSAGVQRTFDADPFRALLGRAVVAGCMLAFPAEARDVILPFPPELSAYEPMHHDRWISLVMAATARVAKIDEPLLDYRVHREQQVGIRVFRIRRLTHPRLWRLAALAVSPAERDLRHTSRVAQLAVLVARLEAAGQLTPAADASIQACSTHLMRRTELPHSRVRRWPVVAQEWRTGAYRDWSLGTSSAITDLVR